MDQGRMFRSHLLECTSCRARVGELRAIAHDLADVERDERRLRTAKRTETKAHEGEDPDGPPAPTPRLGGRITLLVAAGLTILMALSAWNFVLRGRLQQAEQEMMRLRHSVTVFQDGDTWQTVQSSGFGQVSTLNRDLVIMVDGLMEDDYGVYLLDAEDRIVDSRLVEATNSMLYVYVLDSPNVERADKVVVTRTDVLTRTPEGPRAFEARRSDTGTDTEPEIGVLPVGELAG